LPRIAKMSKEEAKLFTPRVCRITFLPIVVICLLIFLLRENLIIFVFGREYQASISVLALLLPGILVFTIWKILANDIIAQGYPLRYSFTAGFSLVTMIALDLYLVPRFGINGAAVASSISYIVATAFIIFIYTKITKNRIRSLLIPVKADLLFYKNIIANIANFRIVEHH